MSDAARRPKLKALGRRLAEHAPVGNVEPGELDCRNLNCPLPVLKARKALQTLAKGQRLTVTATDPMSAIDIPHMCAEDGHRLLSQHLADGVHVYVIERGPLARGEPR